MDYKKLYDCLISRARARALSGECESLGYLERHHIVPRCLGGGDEASNLALVTPEEHFLCHVLLVKIFPAQTRLIIAVQKMTQPIPGRPKRRLYGWLRRKFQQEMKDLQTGEKNSQFGTMWIYKGDTAKKIPYSDCIPDGWLRGRHLRSPSRPKVSDLSKSRLSSSQNLKLAHAKTRRLLDKDIEEILKNNNYDVAQSMISAGYKRGSGSTWYRFTKMKNTAQNNQ